MPRYYFHIQCPDGPIWDSEGSELADLNAVRAEALSSARELLADQIRIGISPDGREFFITDEAENVVMRVPFTDGIGHRRNQWG